MLWWTLALLAIPSLFVIASPTTIGCVTSGLVTTLLSLLNLNGGFSGVTSASDCAVSFTCVEVIAYISLAVPPPASRIGARA
jgi:hypothetical protein